MDGETNYLMKHQMKRGTQRRTEVVAPKPHKGPSVPLPSFFQDGGATRRKGKYPCEN